MVDSKKCPFCSEQIKVTAIKCRYCGKWLDDKSVLPGKASDSLPDVGNMQHGDSQGGTNTVQHQSGNSYYSDTPPGRVDQNRSHLITEPASMSSAFFAQNNMSHNQSSLTGIHLVRQTLGNRYEIIEEIGRGGMAVVYKAVQRSLNRLVALKVVHQNLLHDTEFVARFHREAELCAALNHPNIVTVYDEGEVSNVHFITMEYLEGTDLHKLIRNKGQLNAEQTLQYLLPVAEALDYAHGMGYIHRDIKSANIFITTGGRVVLMDFGIAHAASGTQLTRTGSVIGTPEYMSPEQAEGKKVDHRTDLYSLGVVLYECITGNVPFKGDQPVATIHKVMFEQPNIKKLQHLPQYLQNLTLSLLSKDANMRPGSASELAQSIRQTNEGKNYQQPLKTNISAAKKPAKKATILVKANDQPAIVIKNNPFLDFVRKYVSKNNLRWWLGLIWVISTSIGMLIVINVIIENAHHIGTTGILFSFLLVSVFSFVLPIILIAVLFKAVLHK